MKKHSESKKVCIIRTGDKMISTGDTMILAADKMISAGDTMIPAADKMIATGDTMILAADKMIGARDKSVRLGDAISVRKKRQIIGEVLLKIVENNSLGYL